MQYAFSSEYGRHVTVPAFVRRRSCMRENDGLAFA